MIVPTSHISANSTTSPRRSKSLPVEVLQMIISHLAKKELLACLRVSKNSFYPLSAKALQPVLYSHIDIDLSRSEPPLSLHCSFLGSIDKTILLPSTVACPEQLALHPFGYTKHLTISSHNRSSCSIHFPLHMPLLKTLHITPDDQVQNLDLCSNTPPAFLPLKMLHFQDSISYTEHSPSCCTLISNLRPNHLIIGGVTTDLSGSAKGLWRSPSTFPSFITELTILVGMFSGQEIGTSTTSFFHSLPHTVKRVTLVMSASAAGWALDPKANRTAADRMAIAVTEVIEKIDCQVRIIGSETVARYSSTGYFFEYDIRERLRLSYLAQGRAKDDAEMRSDAVTFHLEEEYERENKWYAEWKAGWIGRDLGKKVMEAIKLRGAVGNKK